MHLKRQKVPKNWPIKRKGTAFVVRPSSNLQRGIPILVILRDILKVAKTRKEVKRAIHSGNIFLNGKKVRDEKNSVSLFDVLKIIPNKYYRVKLSEKGKFAIEDIKESDSFNKIAKIINKKTLKGKKTQLNLSDGRNFLSKIKCNNNDSVLVDFKKGIDKCLPLKEKKKVIVFAGKHAGKIGILNKIDLKKKMAESEVDKKRINVLIKQIMVIE